MQESWRQNTKTRHFGVCHFTFFIIVIYCGVARKLVHVTTLVIAAGGTSLCKEGSESDPVIVVISKSILLFS